MHRTTGTPADEPGAGRASRMDTLVGYVLAVGVLASIALILAGLAWHWLATGGLRFEYLLQGMNLVQFVLADERQWVGGRVQPYLLLNTGFAVLMLTPYVRVFVSMLYFAFWERNWKYTLFTAIVFGVLTYSLFLR
jgi:uncharacterized membrane protein